MHRPSFQKICQMAAKGGSRNLTNVQTKYLENIFYGSQRRFQEPHHCIDQVFRKYVLWQPQEVLETSTMHKASIQKICVVAAKGGSRNLSSVQTQDLENMFCDSQRRFQKPHHCIDQVFRKYAWWQPKEVPGTSPMDRPSIQRICLVAAKGGSRNLTNVQTKHLEKMFCNSQRRFQEPHHCIDHVIQKICFIAAKEAKE